MRTLADGWLELLADGPAESVETFLPEVRESMAGYRELALPLLVAFLIGYGILQRLYSRSAGMYGISPLLKAISWTSLGAPRTSIMNPLT
jgi:hypothetical protein